MAKGKKAKIVGAFVPFPRMVTNHSNFWSLSGHATKLLCLIASQYNGRNNGDFQAGWKYVEIRGFRSKETLSNAKKELLAKGFIVETRKGAFPNLCSLYAITWLGFDWSPKMDIAINGFPSGAWNGKQIA